MRRFSRWAFFGGAGILRCVVAIAAFVQSSAEKSCANEVAVVVRGGFLEGWAMMG